MSTILWNDGNRNGTSLLDFLGERNTDRVIAKLEKLAGRSEWDGYDWWGVSGTFHGVTFTLYTHKSSRVKIGGHDGLDVAGLKLALRDVLSDVDNIDVRVMGADVAASVARAGYFDLADV
jgi:hypothetical protein